MAFHQGAEDVWSCRADRHEEPQLPGDDLGDELHRLEPVDHAIAETGDLDAEVPHDLRAANLEPVLELEDRPPVEHGCKRVGRIESRRLALDRLCDPGGRDQTAEDPLAPRVLPLASPGAGSVGLE